MTAFELFFDLVFVFSLTQVTRLVIEHPDLQGVLRGMLVLALLWWAWGAYAWLTNAVDTDSPSSRLVILTSMGCMLVVAVAVPQASGRDALAFALGYLVVRVLHVLLFAVAGGANRAAILKLAPGNLAASILLIIGVFTSDNIQVLLWTLAVLIDYGTPLITGVGGFNVHAAHFFERHQLFIIIALGESIVAIGVGVLHAEEALTPVVVGAVFLAVLAIGGLWWAYFDWEAALTERVLRNALGSHRAHLARDMFSYLHLLLVVGIVFVAVGLEGVMAHPTQQLHGVQQLGLGAGPALFLLGLSAVSGRRGHRPRIDHLAGAVACLALIPIAAVMPALVTLALLVCILLVIAVMDRSTRIRSHPSVAGLVTPHE